jgi:hypothetical protein
MSSDISPGFYDDIPEGEYHADRESLSISGAKVLLRSPRCSATSRTTPSTRTCSTSVAQRTPWCSARDPR